jgi:hypothetical protein
MMGFHQWPRRSLLVLGLSCIGFGVVTLTVISFKKPWIRRPQIVAEPKEPSIEATEREGEAAIPGVGGKREMEESPLEGGTPEEEKATVSKSAELSMVIPRRGLNEKVVIIGGIKWGKKTPARGRGYKDTIFGREITEGDIKIKEKTRAEISVRKELSASGIKKKSTKKIPKSRPFASEAVELEKERGTAESPRTRTSKRQDKLVGFRFKKKVTQRKRAERVKVKIAKKHVIEDEKATSPVAASSSLVKSKTAITAKKSSIEEKERVIQLKQPSLIATEQEVTQFFADYVERYNQKDIDGFLSLFSPKAIQNQRDGFNEIRRIYSDYFNKSRKLSYHLEDIKIKINQNSAETKGRYKLVQKGKRSWENKVWGGDIRWVLVRENGALKISLLDYTPEKSP